MGSKVHGDLLKAAAEAHYKAIGSIDANDVTSVADYEAVKCSHWALGSICARVHCDCSSANDSMMKFRKSEIPFKCESLPCRDSGERGPRQIKEEQVYRDDVYNSVAGVVDSSVTDSLLSRVTNNMFSKVNPLDAVAAAKGFYIFKDVVEASQH